MTTLRKSGMQHFRVWIEIDARGKVIAVRNSTKAYAGAMRQPGNRIIRGTVTVHVGQV